MRYEFHPEAEVDFVETMGVTGDSAWRRSNV